MVSAGDLYSLKVKFADFKNPHAVQPILGLSLILKRSDGSSKSRMLNGDLTGFLGPTTTMTGTLKPLSNLIGEENASLNVSI